MVSIIKVPVLVEPRLLDIVFKEIQENLVDSLPWLDHAFGKAEKRIEKREKKIMTFPYVYTGSNNDYDKVMPDSHFGNFSFFDVEDGQIINHTGRSIRDSKLKVGIVFWYNYKKIYPDDYKSRTIENVKHEVFEAIEQMVLSKSKLTIHKFWETTEKIYLGYTNREIENQFLMRPYGGFRIDFDLKFLHNIKCD